MTTDPVGLYVHIPFCAAKCNYCDFCSYPQTSDADRADYVERLISEARSYRSNGAVRINSVYLGGGTPSLLSIELISHLFSELSSIFDIAPDAEITIEANPGTLSREKLQTYKALGINRISLGLQSIHENELKILGRIHTYADFLEAYRLAREAGFDNVSIDLMYGIPEQTQESFKQTLDAVIALAPEHISAYGLIIEEGTPFFDNRESLAIVGEDEECDMYFLAAEALRSAGYRHYEISNYAKPGRESKHNLKYWTDSEYIGLGAAAYSYLDGARYGNVRSLSEYMTGAPYENVDVPDREGEMLEYSMMHLRLADGIDLAEYEARFGVPFQKGREAKLSGYEACGLVEIDHGKARLTERGFYLSNTVMADIL